MAPKTPTWETFSLGTLSPQQPPARPPPPKLQVRAYHRLAFLQPKVSIVEKDDASKARQVLEELIDTEKIFVLDTRVFIQAFPLV